MTIRLGGAETISRRSVSAALRTPAAEGQHPTAIVVDLGAQTSTEELDDVRALVDANSLPALVILPEGLAAERGRFVDVGATVLVRPYRPSELYAALWPGEAVTFAAAVNEAPLTIDPESLPPPHIGEQGVAIDDPAGADETEP